MANSATVYARVDPELKSGAESVLHKLGVTPSSLIQMLYSQILLTNSIPFELKIPDNSITSLEMMNKNQLDSELQKGVDDIKNGKLRSAKEVDSILKKEFGI